MAVVLGTGAAAPADEGLAEISGTGNPVTSAMKRGAEKVSDLLKPEEKKLVRRDSISVFDPSTATPELALAMARMAEQSGKPEVADQNYRRAIELDGQRVDSVLGYARFKDRQNAFPEAIRLYYRAIQLEPKMAALHNDLGLCLARQGKLDDSVVALKTAAELDPKRVLFRNNLATVLVELGREAEALSQLQAVHGEAVGHYNLGYLCNKRGKTDAAARHFEAALRADPTLAEAHTWLAAIRSRHPGATGSTPSATPTNRATVTRSTRPPAIPAPKAVPPSDRVLPPHEKIAQPLGSATAVSERNANRATVPTSSRPAEPVSERAQGVRPLPPVATIQVPSGASSSAGVAMSEGGISRSGTVPSVVPADRSTPGTIEMNRAMSLHSAPVPPMPPAFAPGPATDQGFVAADTESADRRFRATPKLPTAKTPPMAPQPPPTVHPLPPVR